MFIAAPFTLAEVWNKAKSRATVEQIYTHTTGKSSAMKRRSCYFHDMYEPRREHSMKIN
jgi:hypothetical protein